MNIHPKRLTMMLDNAVAVSSEGNKPFPYVAVLAAPRGVRVAACGQHVLAFEGHGAASGGPAVVIEAGEAKAIAKALRAIDGYARKEREVEVSNIQGVLRVVDGEPLAEVASLDSEDVDDLLDLLDKAESIKPDPEAAGDFVVDAAIWATLGKLKSDDTRLHVIPRYAGDTSWFKLGSDITGFIEGNRTRPEMIGVAVEDDN
ncbi:hypothetical protein [Brevibacterium moorei]|uniref:hypothetical protein n=1 Tax=Brevibacterium moorei TaxID=2968457 RepID=UPI00211C406C|nr:hypothetical protein [Brevibacterium sp. 68QC2CO]MCQ9385156.1 hypothetical protein [Brevibacterium sp. 68QC2CO]